MRDGWRRRLSRLLIVLLAALQMLGSAQAARQELHGIVAEDPYQIPCTRNAVLAKAERLYDAGSGVFEGSIWARLFSAFKTANEFMNSLTDFVAYQSMCVVIKNTSDALGQFACFLFDTFVDPIFSPREPSCAEGDPYITVPDSAGGTESSGGEATTTPPSPPAEPTALARTPSDPGARPGETTTPHPGGATRVP